MKTVFMAGASFERSPFWLAQAGAIPKAERDALLRQLSVADTAGESIHPWTKALNPDDAAKFDDLKKKSDDLSLTVFQIRAKLKSENPVAWVLSDQEKALVGAYADMMGRLYALATGQPYTSGVFPAPKTAEAAAPVPETGIPTTTVLVVAGGAVVLAVGAALLLS
jgi:hypothetical protein